MQIWNGAEHDTTNNKSKKFIQINSCGFQYSPNDFLVTRESGRYDYLILLVNKGTCFAEHNSKEYSLSPGNLVIYKPDEKQKYLLKANSETLWCHFTGNTVKEILEDTKIKSGIYFFKPNIAIFDSYSTLIQKFHQPGKKNYSTVAFLNLIYNISEKITQSEKSESMNLIITILTYINANYNKSISLGDLAKRTGYSKSRFSHIFAEITGTTPIKYQNDIRLKTSREMLLSTNLTIQEIAINCGFHEPLYFSRVFKKKYNLSPSEYRKQQRII